MAKTRRILLILIKVALLCYAILVGVRCFVDPDYNKYGGCLAGLILPFVPEIISRLFKCRIAFRIELLYYIFLFVALDMGICMDFYKTVPYFDKIIHFCSGIFSALIGHYALVYFKLRKAPSVFKALFIMFTSMAIALTWEFFEFGCDKLIGQSMQQLISVGVDDTMFDLITATIGAAVGGYLLTVPHLVDYLEAL